MRTCSSGHTQSHTYNSTKKTLNEKMPGDVLDQGWVYKHVKEHVLIARLLELKCLLDCSYHHTVQGVPDFHIHFWNFDL